MQKLYPKSVFTYIENLMKDGQLEIRRFSDYSEILPMNKITLGDIKVSFMKSDHPKIPGYLAASYCKEGVGRAYTELWNQLPIKSHMLKDFKKLVTDKNGDIPYLALNYKDKDGKQKTALVRELFEIEDMDADDPEALEYYTKYADIEHNDKVYMVVKIVNFGDPYSVYEKTFLTREIVNYDGYIPSYCPDEETEEKAESTNALF